MKTIEISKEQVEKFRSQVIQFVRWVEKQNKADGLWEDSDIPSIKSAKTFAEIEKILVRHDDGNFMYMVSEGMI